MVFFEHKGLLASKGEPAPPDHIVELGQANVVREGDDVTVVALASTVRLARTAAEQLAADDISVEVIDLRCLVPLDVSTVLASVDKTSRLVIVEENPYQGGWWCHRCIAGRRRGLRVSRCPDSPRRRRVRAASVR